MCLRMLPEFVTSCVVVRWLYERLDVDRKSTVDSDEVEITLTADELREAAEDRRARG